MTVSTQIAAFAAANNAEPPLRLGQRYNATRFLPEAGNTVVCHLDTSAPAHHAVVAARARMMALTGERFLYTPLSSLHMTVFEGALETRRTADAWPADIDRDAPIDSVTKTVGARLASFAAPPAFAVRMAALRPTGLVLTGATAADDATMRAWREALTTPFGYRHNDHDCYHYHMTFAYPVDWIPDALLPQWEAEINAIRADLCAAASVIPLTVPAFCAFADMTHFEPLRDLA